MKNLIFCLVLGSLTTSAFGFIAYTEVKCEFKDLKFKNEAVELVLRTGMEEVTPYQFFFQTALSRDLVDDTLNSKQFIKPCAYTNSCNGEYATLVGLTRSENVFRLNSSVFVKLFTNKIGDYSHVEVAADLIGPGVKVLKTECGDPIQYP